MSRLKDFGRRIHAALERIAESNKRHVEKVLGRLPSQDEIEAVDYATDADLAILRELPLPIDHSHAASTLEQQPAGTMNWYVTPGPPLRSWMR